MAGRSHRCTPKLIEEIARFVEAGAYDHVAAEACGLPREVLERWLQRGAAPRAPRSFRALQDRLRKARAVARLLAETRLHEKEARQWLKSGPGRETPDAAGWSKDVAAQRRERQPDYWNDVEWQKKWSRILQILEAFPDARLAVAEELSVDS